MELGMIGLGRMGSNMVQRLVLGGHPVVVCDLQEEAVIEVVNYGAVSSSSLEDLVAQLTTPRAVWVMVPAGKPTENTINSLSKLLSAGDVVIDGGNSNYKDSIRRAKFLKDSGIFFLDVGTSGGVWGLKEGYSLMVGGSITAFRRLEPIFQTLAPALDRGYGHVGCSGSGHFVKMVHNGIEYGLMQAYAEGFEILHAKKEFSLDSGKIAEIWKYGSVIRSWLLDLASDILTHNSDLSDIEGFVADSGEGRWTVAEAVDLGVAAPIITLSLQQRLRSQDSNPFADRLLAALRQSFGGHEVKKTE